MRVSTPVSAGVYCHYRISGLRVGSEIPLHGSIEDVGGDGAPDVVVRLGHVPAVLDGAVSIGPNWQFAPPFFLVEVPGVVRFLVKSGAEILVDPEPGISLDDAAIFIVGTAIAVALYQRRALILHASAVASDGFAYAFVGASGAGKSTLAALLCLDGGCEVVSDDVSAIDVAGDTPVLKADGRRFRLWEDSIDLLKLAEHRGRAVRSMIHKFHVALPAHRADTELPLRGIYILDTLPPGTAPLIESLPAGRAAFALDHHRYRRRLANQINTVAERFALMARLVDRVPVFLFHRAISADDNSRSIACLKAHWESLA